MRKPNAAGHWRRVREIFDAVADLGPAAREQALDAHCAGDPDLRREVAALLAHDRSADDPLDHIVALAAAEAVEAARPGDGGDPSRPAAGAAFPAASPGAFPETIGRYRLIEQLGEGGMGVVFLAEDTSLGRRVALKLPPAHLADDPGVRQRLQQEARAAATLSHPHVCVVHEVGDGPGGRPFIAMELIEGETLAARIQRGPLRLADVLTLGRQAADALAAAHAQGVVHRDLKPSNIMFTGHGIKLLDFGLASVTQDAMRSTSTVRSAVTGTVPYMSPEQVRGEALDARTDLFSLGVVLYEAVTGRLPFNGATRREMFAAITEREPDPPSSINPLVPAALEQVLMRALAKPVAARHQTAAELAAELATIDRRAIPRPTDTSQASSSQTDASRTGSSRSDVSQAGGFQTSRIRTGSTQAGSVPTDGSLAEGIRDDGAQPPRRWPAAMLYAAAAAAVVAAIVMVFGWTAVRDLYFRAAPADSRGDARGGSASPAASSPRDVSVLLAEFRNTTGDATFDGTLRQALAVQLEQSPVVRLFPRAGVQETLRKMKLAPGSRLSPEVAAEVARQRGLDAWIDASIAATVEGGYAVSLVARTGGGQELAREEAKAAGKGGVLQALDAAAARLRERLGEPAQSIGRFNAPIQRTTTASLDALKAYAFGTQQAERGDYEMAATLFERAVRIDRDFAMGYQALAREQHNSQHPRHLFVASATRAYQLRERATEQERFSIETSYYTLVMQALDRAVDSAEAWKAAYPREFRPYHVLADLYFTLGHFERAAENGREAVRLNPDVAAAYSNFAASLFALGRLEEARGVYRQAMARGLDAPEYHAFLWRIAYYTGDEDEMRRQVDWAAASSSWGHNLPALIAGLQGRWTAARASSRDASAFFARRGMPGLVALAARYESTTGALVGDCATTRRSAPGTLAFDYDDDNSRVMVALALCGDTARPHAWLQKMRRSSADSTLQSRVALPVLEAAIEMRRGRAAAALRALEPVAPYENAHDAWPIYVRGLALLQSGAAAEARDEFLKIADRPSRAFWSPLAPLARLGAARARALAGDRDGARADYEQLFMVWKDADPDLPVMIEARAEYERLR